MSSNKKFGCLFFFLTPILIFGIGLLGYSFYIIYKAVDTHSWSKVKADIVSADILHSSGRRGTNLNKVIAKYTYEVNGVKFTNDDITIHDSFNNFEDNYTILETLKNAQSIFIYVNPDQPSESVIIKGFNSVAIFMILFTAIFDGMVFVFSFPFILRSLKEENNFFN